jgi:hypothetical protein
MKGETPIQKTPLILEDGPEVCDPELDEEEQGESRTGIYTPECESVDLVRIGRARGVVTALGVGRQ